MAYCQRADESLCNAVMCVCVILAESEKELPNEQLRRRILFTTHTSTKRLVVGKLRNASCLACQLYAYIYGVLYCMNSMLRY